VLEFLLLVLEFLLLVLEFLLLVLEFLLLVLEFLAVLGFLLVVTSDGGGSRLTPSGIGVTHLGTARRVRRPCRWLTAAKG